MVLLLASVFVASNFAFDNLLNLGVVIKPVVSGVLLSISVTFFIKNRFCGQISNIRHFIFNFCSCSINSSFGSQFKNIRYFILNLCLNKPLSLGPVIRPYLIKVLMLGIFSATSSIFFFKILFL